MTFCSKSFGIIILVVSISECSYTAVLIAIAPDWGAIDNESKSFANLWTLDCQDCVDKVLEDDCGFKVHNLQDSVPSSLYTCLTEPD